MKRSIILAALVGAAVAAQASILTFDGKGTNGQIPADWGSNIAAAETGISISNGTTPNIALSWSVDGNERWEFYNDSEWSAAQMNDFRPSDKYQIALAPDAGYGVTFESFVFDDYTGWQGGNDFSWSLYQDTAGGTLIASGSETTTDGQNLLVNTGMASAYYGTVVFEIINNDTVINSDSAIDNVTFTQISDPQVAPPGSLPGELKIFGQNVWINGNNVSDGVNKVADLVIASDADIVAFTEARNFLNPILAALEAKGTSNYVGMTLGDRTLISRFPITGSTAIHGSISAFEIALPNELPLTVAVAHLDYTHYAVYLPRGYNGGAAPYAGWGMIDNNGDGVPDYIDDIPAILSYDLTSSRDEALATFIAFAAPLTAAGEDVILLGDFNDCSHLDWVDATRNMFGHNDLVIPWNGSVNLANNGWIDTFRECHPNPVTHPGMTWPSEAYGKESTAWAPKSDERDRIDFIYYNKQKLNAQKSNVVGSRTYYKLNVKDDIESEETFLLKEMDWPSDHKGVLATFFMDSDMDDMPDTWEIEYGLNPTNAADALIDTDLDTMNNLDEYRSRTNPTNANSLLKIDLVDVPDGSTIPVGWPSHEDLQYRLKESSDLENWNILQDHILPVPPTNTFNYTMTNSTSFLKVEAIDP